MKTQWQNKNYYQGQIERMIQYPNPLSPTYKVVSCSNTKFMKVKIHLSEDLQVPEVEEH
eukprot:c1837_g1_i1 orf=1-174(-)